MLNILSYFPHISPQWFEYLELKKNPDCKTIPPIFEVEIATKDGKPVTAHGGLSIQPDIAMGDIERTNVILIPAHLFRDQPLKNSIHDIIEWIIFQYRNQSRICGICTGTFILGMTGLLDGRIATTNWLYIRNFKAQFPKVILKPERILTDDLGLICTGAATSAMSLWRKGDVYDFMLFSNPYIEKFSCKK